MGKKMGRPTGFNKTMQDFITFLAGEGNTDAQMAAIVGVSQQTLDNWKKAHPEFFGSLKVGKHIADGKVEDSLYKKALGYTKDGKYFPPDTTAQIFWLKNRKPQEWRDKKEIETEVKGTVKHKHFTVEDLKKAIEKDPFIDVTPKKIKDKK